MEGADFSGWATKSNMKCSDGITIMPGAFKGQDQMVVPLVWQHGHDTPDQVLGHAILEEREEGTYAYGFFNDSPAAQTTKELVRHGDIKAMSIWANDLIKRAEQVLHGKIRELSLVLSGANPGALIENVTIRHSAYDEEILEGQGILTTGDEIVIEHADGDNGASDDSSDDDEEETIEEIFATMTEKQRNAALFVIGSLKPDLAAEEDGEKVEHSDLEAADGDDGGDDGDDGDDAGDDSDEDGDDADNNDGDNANNQEGTEDMSEKLQHTNVFEGKASEQLTGKHVISHADKTGIFSDAMKSGSMKDAVENYCIAHGITSMDIMFPDAKNPDGGVPQFLKRRTEWVSGFMEQTTKTPFSRIKNLWADITEDDARAKGYITGSLKKEEFFGVAKRVTVPTTVYKKQKLDRDDIIDITDFDVVAWLKMEMRVMLDEEIARAALIGDGRDVASEDKINEQCIRPIAGEHELFTVQAYVNLDDASSSIQEFIDQVIRTRAKYRGTGQPTMYTSESVIAGFLLLKDTLGRDLYPSIESLALKLRVREIVPVEVLETEPDIVAIMVNPVDYTFGATKGGEVTLFDQFDIDYNKEKYLIETRVSGSLTKLKSAIVFRRTASTSVQVTPAQPAFNTETGALTITNQTGVVYKNEAGTTINAAGSPYAVAPGATYRVYATPATGYHFATSEDDAWAFTRDDA